MVHRVDLERIRNLDRISRLVEYINTPEAFRKFLGIWARGVKIGYFGLNLEALKELGYIMRGYEDLFNNAFDDEAEFAEEIGKFSKYFLDNLLDSENFVDKDFYDRHMSAIYNCTLDGFVDYKWFKDTKVYEEIDEKWRKHCFEGLDVLDENPNPFVDIAISIYSTMPEEAQQYSIKYGKFLIKMIEDKIVNEIKT